MADYVFSHLKNIKSRTFKIRGTCEFIVNSNFNGVNHQSLLINYKIISETTDNYCKIVKNPQEGLQKIQAFYTI
jgi:hypothetical protein